MCIAIRKPAWVRLRDSVSEAGTGWTMPTAFQCFALRCVASCTRDRRNSFGTLSSLDRSDHETLQTNPSAGLAAHVRLGAAPAKPDQPERRPAPTRVRGRCAAPFRGSGLTPPLARGRTPRWLKSRASTALRSRSRLAWGGGSSLGHSRGRSARIHGRVQKSEWQTEAHHSSGTVRTCELCRRSARSCWPCPAPAPARAHAWAGRCAGRRSRELN